MLTKIARFISIIFHPLVMPSIGILIIFHAGAYFSLLPFEMKRSIFYIIILITLFLPLTVLPFLKLVGLITDYNISSSNQRIVPLLVTLIFYITGYYFLMRFPVIPRFIQNFMLAASISIALTLLITLKWKISIHMVGIGGLTGIIIALAAYHPLNYPLYLVGVLFVAGIIGTVRLFLNEHVPLQVYSGYFLGFFTVLISILAF